MERRAMHPAMTQLAQLPVAERIELVQDLWDSIGEAREQLPVQEWHRQLALARLADLDGREGETGISEEEVWNRVEKRCGS